MHKKKTIIFIVAVLGFVSMTLLPVNFFGSGLFVLGATLFATARFSKEFCNYHITRRRVKSGYLVEVRDHDDYLFEKFLSRMVNLILFFLGSLQLIGLSLILIGLLIILQFGWGR